MADLSLAKLQWQAQLAVFVLLAAAGAGSFYYFYETPAQERIAMRDQELATIQRRLDNALARARQLDEFKKEVARLQAELESLKPILPDEKDAADLLRRVNTLALQSNLTIRSFRPQATTTRQMHAEWPITLELEGTYHNLGAFLDSVSKFPRIINISGIEIRGRQQPSPNATIDVTCTATTFVLLEGAPAGADSGRAAAGPATSE